MHRQGHAGMAMIGYAPMIVLLLALHQGYLFLALTGFSLTTGLSMLPDIDMKIGFIKHRGPTHTVWFALLVAVIFGAIGVVTGNLIESVGVAEFAGVYGAEPAPHPPLFVGAVFFITGFLIVGSHLLADMVTPMGIAPFEPVSPRHYSLDLARADNKLANVMFYGIGWILTGIALLLSWEWLFTGLFGSA